MAPRASALGAHTMTPPPSVERRTVTRQLSIDAPLAACSPFVFEPVLMGEWFADVTGTLAAGSAFRFDFGDGDLFAGQVRACEPPHQLCLTWRFMNVGTESAIVLQLQPAGDARTEVIVSDTAEYTAEGAAELGEGWEDFLARLKKRVETGRRSRYRWGELIGAGALVALDAEALSRRVLQDEVWAAAFPTATTSLELAVDPPVLRLTDPAWDGLSTEATLRISPRRGGSALVIVHGGWIALPEERQMAERRRHAGLWAAFLARLESELGRPGEAAIAQSRRSAPDPHSLL